MAIKKEVVGDKGAISTYHRIDKINFDYLLDRIKIEVAHYADDSFRNVEKEAEAEIKNDIETYHEIMACKEDDTITNRQVNIISAMNIQELEALRIPQTLMGTTEYCLEDTGIDFRENLYQEIVKIIPQLQNSKGV